MDGLGSGVFVMLGAFAVMGIFAAVIVRIARKSDWAGGQQPQQPEEPKPEEPQQRPRRIDDTERFREQNRPTDPPSSS